MALRSPRNVLRSIIVLRPDSLKRSRPSLFLKFKTCTCAPLEFGDVRSWCDLEDDAPSVVPALLSRAIQVSLLVEDKTCGEISPVGAALPTGTVEDRFLAFWSELEYDTRVLFPAARSRPIKVSLLVNDHPRLGTVPVGTVDLPTEAVKDCLLVFWSELEYNSAASGL